MKNKEIELLERALNVCEKSMNYDISKKLEKLINKYKAKKEKKKLPFEKWKFINEGCDIRVYGKDLTEEEKKQFNKVKAVFGSGNKQEQMDPANTFSPRCPELPKEETEQVINLDDLKGLEVVFQGKRYSAVNAFHVWENGTNTNMIKVKVELSFYPEINHT